MRTYLKHCWLPIVLLGLAVTRTAKDWGSARQSKGLAITAPSLPAVLNGQQGRSSPADASERLLAASPRVKLTRRVYGTTRVALLTTSGVKEHHPPKVCLEAEGFEVVNRQEEQSRAGCLVSLTVRSRDGVLGHFYYTYFNRQAVTCSFWRRAGSAAWARLRGRAGGNWSTLQVLDRDPARAREVITLLIHATRRTS